MTAIRDDFFAEQANQELDAAENVTEPDRAYHVARAQVYATLELANAVKLLDTGGKR